MLIETKNIDMDMCWIDLVDGEVSQHTIQKTERIFVDDARVILYTTDGFTEIIPLHRVTKIRYRNKEVIP